MIPSSRINYQSLFELLQTGIINNSGSREAHVTAWFTAFLYGHGLLFDNYWPQNNKGGVLGAAEHDFSMLDKDDFSVIVELKSHGISRDALKKALLTQAYRYASGSRNFKKGIIVAFNGSSYFYTYVFCPTKNIRLQVNTDKIIEGQVFTLQDLKKFAKIALLHKQDAVDKGVASLYGVTPFLKTIIKEINSSSKLSISINEMTILIMI